MQQPIITPQFYNPDAKFLWVLDPGHGKETKGKRSPVWEDGRQILEYAFNRDMVFRIMLKAHAAGLRVYNLVQEDWDVSLNERVNRVNAIKSDIPKVLVSVHANAFAQERANGVEVFSTKGETISDPVATVFAEKFFECLGMVERSDYSDGDPDKEANFRVISGAHCRAILLEYGFMTNEEDAERLMDVDWREAAAQTTVEAMLEYENKFGTGE